MWVEEASTDVRRLSRAERYDLVDAAYVSYPRTGAILAQFEYLYEHARRSPEPLGLLLTGSPGVGKTTLTEVFEAQHPPDVSGPTVKRPVVLATVPSRATEKGLAAALLKGMGDPRWHRGSVNDMTYRLMEYLHDCETRLLVLDEIQHFVDSNSRRVGEDGARWLKNLLKDKQVKLSCVLVGLPGQSELFLAANDRQLECFFGDARVLAPLGWHDANGSEACEFRLFLREVEPLLPLPLPSHLADEDTAWRCFVATGGVVRFVMRLIRRAARLAIDTDQDCITRMLLAEAFDLDLAGERHGVPNPFDDDVRPEAPAHNWTAGKQGASQQVRQILRS